MNLKLMAVLLCFTASLCADDIATLRSRADQGDVSAIMEFADAYESGKDVPQNQATAVEWYHKAAERGNVEAENTLGVKYRLGGKASRKIQPPRSRGTKNLRETVTRRRCSTSAPRFTTETALRLTMRARLPGS